jgi:hypothetical protein
MAAVRLITMKMKSVQKMNEFFFNGHKTYILSQILIRTCFPINQI